jgi:hypothetical protein
MEMRIDKAGGDQAPQGIDRARGAGGDPGRYLDDPAVQDANIDRTFSLGQTSATDKQIKHSDPHDRNQAQPFEQPLARFTTWSIFSLAFPGDGVTGILGKTRIQEGTGQAAPRAGPEKLLL